MKDFCFLTLNRFATAPEPPVLTGGTLGCVLHLDEDEHQRQQHQQQQQQQSKFNFWFFVNFSIEQTNKETVN